MAKRKICLILLTLAQEMLIITHGTSHSLWRLRLKDSVGLIGQGIIVTGEINFDGTLRIEGKVIGSISGAMGTVSIGGSGHVEADITTNICIVDGTLEGDLIATTRVEITRTGHIKGDVITPDLSINEGAILEGNLKMVKNNTSETGNSNTPEQQSSLPA